MLKKRIKIIAVLSFVAAGYADGPVLAATETLGSTVTATVYNNFTLTEISAVNFGTIVAIADTQGVSDATLTIPATGSVPVPANSAPAKFIIIDSTAASNGVFEVTGAAPDTSLNVATFALSDLTCGGCAGSPPNFTLSAATPEFPTVTTNGSGEATIRVGAQIVTQTTGTQYTDGVYTGSFQLSVSY